MFLVSSGNVICGLFFESMGTLCIVLSTQMQLELLLLLHCGPLILLQLYQRDNQCSCKRFVGCSSVHTMLVEFLTLKSLLIVFRPDPLLLLRPVGFERFVWTVGET